MSTQDEKKAFVRTLCLVSVMMASVCFFGVSIIISIYFNLPENVSESAKAAWLNVANAGIFAVIIFAVTSLGALLLMAYNFRLIAPSLRIWREEKKPIKQKRLSRIAKIEQRIKNMSMTRLLLSLFLIGWAIFFLMTYFLYGVFHA